MAHAFPASAAQVPPPTHLPQSPPPEDWNDGDFDFQDCASPASVLQPSCSEGVLQLGSDPIAGDGHQDDLDFFADSPTPADNEFDAGSSRRGKVTPFAAARPASSDVEEDWDRDDDDDEEDEEAVSTVKLSSVAGSTLASLSKAEQSTSDPMGPFTGTVTQLGRSRASTVASRVDTEGGGDWDEDIEMPDLLPSKPALRRPASFASDLEVDEGGLGSQGSTSASSASALGAASTDLTDFESPKRRQSTSSPPTDYVAARERASARARGGSLSALGSPRGSNYSASRREPGSCPSSASSMLSPSQKGHHASHVSFDAKPDADDELEADFELAPQLERLALSPLIARQRSHSTLEQERLLWGDSGSNRSSSPEAFAFGSAQSPIAAGGASPSTSGSAASYSAPESDADDEPAEDALEGLVFPDSIFEPDSLRPNRGATLSTSSARAKLQAMLDARKAGLGLPGIGGAFNATGMGAGPGSPKGFDAETDFVAGLVITDDLDLSPSRLKAKSLSFKLKSSTGRGGPQTAHTFPPKNRQLRSGTMTNPERSSATPMTPRRSTVVARGGPESFGPNTPSLTFTGSSPARPLPGYVHASPPRAPSAYTHAPGGGPRQTVAVPGRSLRYKKSTSNLLAPAGGAGGMTPGPAGPSRPRAMTRKRSLPALSDSQGSASGSVPPVPVPEIPRSGSTNSMVALASGTHSSRQSSASRLTASTVASRARAAETATTLAARATPSYRDDTGLFEPDVPPARPSTPVQVSQRGAGAMRFSMPTLRRAGMRSPALDAAVAADATVSRPRSRSPKLIPATAAAVAAAASDAASRMMRKPKRTRQYGDGHELDAFDDLPTSAEREGRFRKTPTAPVSPSASTSARMGPVVTNMVKGNLQSAAAVRKKVSTAQLRSGPDTVGGPSFSGDQGRGNRTDSNRPVFPSGPSGWPSPVPGGATPRSAARRKKGSAGHKKPTLIRALGGAPAAPRVVGEMRWNPISQRWEGNDAVLRDFDNALNSSARPALITQLTGSSTTSLVHASSGVWSPGSSGGPGVFDGARGLGGGGGGGGGGGNAGYLANGTRVVGDMVFDPVRMCWLARGGTEEPDVFAELDLEMDEESDGGPRSESGGEGFLSISGPGVDEGAEGPAREDADKESTIKGRPSWNLLRPSDADAGAYPSPSLSATSSAAASPRAPRSSAGSFVSFSGLDDEGAPFTSLPPSELADAGGVGGRWLGVDPELVRASLAAEKRHFAEVRGFVPRGTVVGSQSQRVERPDDGRAHLYLLQRLARQAGR